MFAFHNDQALKNAKIAQVEAHERHDEIVKGRYWENGKGCAVGCTIHGSDHMQYESQLGIPVMLARLQDRIFEGMSNEQAKRFPRRFLVAVRPGADLSLVGWKFLHWLIDDGLQQHGTPAVREGCAAALEVLNLRARGETVTAYAARAAADAAADAAAYAADAAAYAARAAAYAAADAARAAAYAARAAYAAADAARAAAYAAADAAAYVAAYAAADAAAYVAADAAAYVAAYNRQAEKLLELLEAA